MTGLKVTSTAENEMRAACKRTQSKTEVGKVCTRTP